MPSVYTMWGAWIAKAETHAAEAASARERDMPGCAWVFDCARRDALAKALLCEQITLDIAASEA